MIGLQKMTPPQGGVFLCRRFLSANNSHKKGLFKKRPLNLLKKSINNLHYANNLKLSKFYTLNSVVFGFSTEEKLILLIFLCQGNSMYVYVKYEKITTTIRYGI